MHACSNKMNLKIMVLMIILLSSTCLKAQSFSDEKVSLTNFIKRMYTSTPFEGVKIIDDYNHQYLVSIISLDKSNYTSESTLNRVAQVKAQSQANTFLNGAAISMDMVITTKESTDSSNKNTTILETVEQIRQNSVGFTQGLELLTNFDSSNKQRTVFVYAREMRL